MTVIMPYRKINFGFEVLAAAATKSSVFWDIKPPFPLKVNIYFAGTYCLHF
jgi:hypothetical protein